MSGTGHSSDISGISVAVTRGAPAPLVHRVENGEHPLASGLTADESLR